MPRSRFRPSTLVFELSQLNDVCCTSYFLKYRFSLGLSVPIWLQTKPNVSSTDETNHKFYRVILRIWPRELWCSSFRSACEYATHCKQKSFCCRLTRWDENSLYLCMCCVQFNHLLSFQYLRIFLQNNYDLVTIIKFFFWPADICNRSVMSLLGGKNRFLNVVLDVSDAPVVGV